MQIDFAVIGGSFAGLSAALQLARARRRVLRMAGLFTQPRTSLASPVAAQLGCAMVDGPMGPFIQVGPTQETSVPHVFACGDAARAAGSVALAVGDGVMAGFGAHRSTMF